MFDPSSITILDITSPSHPSDEYILSHDVYVPEFQSYHPNPAKLDKIRAWLDQNNENLQIRAFGAVWCKDCIEQLPRIAKIAKELNDPRFTLEILGKIKVKAPYAREEGKTIWIVPPSPPETNDTRFDMFHIPAIYIFNKDGKCLGKIDEKLEHTKTMETEILHYLLK